jgi:hypothetical protein
MTGVEAVSNGMTAFREPAVKYGHRTLTAIVGILGILLLGIAFLARAYGIGAMSQEQDGYRSVLSQIAAAVVGQGVLYYTTIGSLLCVLAFSANTSFVDFPRLCRVVAEDGFLPKSFAIAGRRLVFDVGILYLALTSGILLIAFGGITDRLIPLFAIGAFLTFTMSQAGMVWHWRRSIAAGHSTRENKTHLAVNTAGALTTGLALIIIVAAKFLEGAWITILVLPIVIVLLKGIRSYYDRLFDELRAAAPIELSTLSAPIAVVAFESWTKLSENALTFAMSISPNVTAIHLLKLSGPDQEEERRRLEERWRTQLEEPLSRAGMSPPRLVILQSQYRNLQIPMVKLINEIKTGHPGKRIAVLIPDVVKDRWYQHLLHTHRAARLRSRLLRMGDEDLTVINVPLRIRHGAKHDPPSKCTAQASAVRRRPTSRSAGGPEVAS